MIVAAGLTPAWQQILSFDAVRWGEVNRAAAVERCASGKVLNVGIALAHLGAKAVTIAPLGGPARDAVAGEFSRLRAAARWIDVASPTRVCTTLIEQGGARITELVENAAELSAEELDRFEAECRAAMAEASIVVLTGSVPRGTPADLFARLLDVTATPAILDLRGPELTATLDRRPLMVKPNREELALTVGRPLDDDAALRRAMHELNEHGAGWVVVTEGGRTVWATSAGKCYRLAPPSVQVVNPIGSGDSFAAAVAWRLAAGCDPLSALRAGVAAGALNASVLLPGRIDARQVELLADSITIEMA